MEGIETDRLVAGGRVSRALEWPTIALIGQTDQIDHDL